MQNTNIYERKTALQAKAAVLYNFFYTIPKWAPLLNTIFQMSPPFERKEGRLFKGDAH